MLIVTIWPFYIVYMYGIISLNPINMFNYDINSKTHYMHAFIQTACFEYLSCILDWVTALLEISLLGENNI